jgi:hypothetical protein
LIEITLKFVVPAKAGTQCLYAPDAEAKALDPRFRGDDDR